MANATDKSKSVKSGKRNVVKSIAEPLGGNLSNIKPDILAIIALVFSLVSVLISVLQSYFAYDTIRITRKSLGIDKKVDACVDFLGEAKSLTADLSNPLLLWITEQKVKQSREKFWATIDESKLAFLNSPFSERITRLGIVGAKAKLLLPTQIGTQMEKFSEIANDRTGKYLLGFGQDDTLKKMLAMPIVEDPELVAAVNMIEISCGLLVEKDAT